MGLIKPEGARHLFHFVIEGMSEHIVVDISQKVNQALLLSSVDAVVGRIEIRDKNSCEAAKNVLRCASIAIITIDVGHALNIRKRPHVPDLLINRDARLVGMHDRSSNDTSENPLVKL